MRASVRANEWAFECRTNEWRSGANKRDEMRWTRSHTKVNHCCDKIDVCTSTVDKELLKLYLTPQLMCVFACACIWASYGVFACVHECACRCVASSTLLSLQIVIIQWRLTCFSPMIHHLFKCQQMSMPTAPSLKNDVYRIASYRMVNILCNRVRIYNIWSMEQFSRIVMVSNEPQTIEILCPNINHRLADSFNNIWKA